MGRLPIGTRGFGRYTVSYQVTMNIGDSEDDARGAFDEYISKYYPELSQAMDLSNWGPVGTPDQIAAVLQKRLTAGLRRIAFFVIPSAVAFLVLGDVLAAALYQSGHLHCCDAVDVW